MDSAVAAKLLQQESTSELIGFSHIVWPESKCCSTVCLDQCQLFCHQLKIPYYKIDCIVPFCKKVVDPFVETYHNGKTPNPCVWCNQYVRFDAMLTSLFQKQPKLKTENYKIATGHYVQVEYANNRYHLKQGKDSKKNQSYMLYRLTQDQLSHCIFPLGILTKQKVRQLATEWGLCAAQKPDSQDACFVKDTYPNFLKEYSKKIFPKGNFIDKNGKILGTHQGTPYYTRGQRRGLGLSGGPWIVETINPAQHTILLGRKSDLNVSRFTIKDCNWIEKIDEKIDCTVQTRYHAQEIKCTLIQQENKSALIELHSPIDDVTPGQSAVFYMDEYVLGGGIIDPI